MSKRRVLGKSSNIKDKNDNEIIKSLKLNQSDTIPEDDFICPMCNLPMKSLKKLNDHVDTIHLNKDIEKTKDNQNINHIHKHNKNHNNIPNNQNINQTSNLQLKLPVDHYKRPKKGVKCSYPKCNVKVGLKNNLINCSKCGNLYCSNHCNILLKLNSNLQIINQFSNDGIICKCCLNCLNNFTGWNGVIGKLNLIDKTNEFKKIRILKNNENALNNLILEKRFEKIFNWLIINYSNLNSNSLNSFENELCNWKANNQFNKCKICNITFNFFVRKHHCRICGDVVCGNINKGCSMIVPLGIIFDLMKIDRLNDDDDDSNKYEKISNSLKNDNYGIRVCFDCKTKVLNKRVFKLDQLQLNNSEFINIFKMWKLIYHKIQIENISEIKNDDENLILVTLFQKLDKLIKKIDEITLNNENKNNIPYDEIRMLNTLKGSIVNYIQLKLPILRKAQEDKLLRERKVLQNLIDDKPKLTKKDIRIKREKLMVLNEQKFVVENLYEDFKKERRFDDLETLDSNLEDIEKEIQQLTEELGDEAFH